MSEENNNTEMVSKLEFENQKKELEKLQKIFDERQTREIKREDLLKKDELLKVLGIEKDPEKDATTLVSEKLLSLSEKVESLNKQLEGERLEKELVKKQAQAKDIIAKLNPHNADDALAFINLNSETLASDIEALKASKPYLFKPQNAGGPTNPSGSSNSTVNPFKAGINFSYTQQGLLMQENPALAQKYKQEAGLA